MRDKVENATYFEFRPGIDQFPEWRGARYDADPGSLPMNALAMPVNVRFEPGGVRSRYGIKAVATLPKLSPSGTWAGAPGEQVNYLGMHHMQFRAPRLWVAAPGCLNRGFTNGAFLRWHNPDKSPETQLVGSYVAAADRIPAIGAFNGDMYFGDWGVLQKPNVIELSRGEPITIAVGQLWTEQVVGFENRDVYGLQEFDGKLYIALLNTADPSLSEVRTWDGVTLATDEVTGSVCGTNFCVWRDSKLVMTAAGRGEVMVRSIDGTWNTYAMPGGRTMYHDYKNSMAEFRDVVYIANGTDILMVSTFDSPAVTVAHTVSGAGTGSITSVATLNDCLYYVYNLAGGQIWVGMYEPDVATGYWVDDFKRIDTDLTANFQAVAGATTMITYRNRLYVGGGRGVVATHTLSYEPGSEWFEAMPLVGTKNVSALRVA